VVSLLQSQWRRFLKFPITLTCPDPSRHKTSLSYYYSDHSWVYMVFYLWDKREKRRVRACEIDGGDATWTHFVFYSPFCHSMLASNISHNISLYINYKEAMKGVRCSTKWGQRHIHWRQQHDVTHLFWSLVSLLFPANSCQKTIQTKSHTYNNPSVIICHASWSTQRVIEAIMTMAGGGRSIVFFCFLCVSHKAQRVSAGHSREVFQIKSVK